MAISQMSLRYSSNSSILSVTLIHVVKGLGGEFVKISIVTMGFGNCEQRMDKNFGHIPAYAPPVETTGGAPNIFRECKVGKAPAI